MKNSQTALFLLGLMLVLPLLAAAAPLPSGQDQAKKVNINTASSAELQSLPRIGEKVAQRIIDFRKEHGPFKKIEDLMKVKGIGEKTFLNLKDRITIANEKTA